MHGDFTETHRAHDVAGDEAHQERVDDALDRDLRELRQAKRLPATEPAEHPREHDTDREREKEIDGRVALAELHQQACHDVRRVANAQENDAEVVGEKDG